MGKDDWEDRKDGFFEDYTTFVENGESIYNFKKYGHPLVRVKPGKGRNYVAAISTAGGIIHLSVVTDQSKLRKRGYMATPADWKNVEITIYTRVKNVDWNQPLPRLSLAARGYHHHSSNNPLGNPCEGSAYYVVLKVDGSVALQKELFHRAYGAEEEGKTFRGPVLEHPLLKNPSTSDPRDHRNEPRWIGMKGIFYTNENGNPKIELWLDKEANNDWGTEPVLNIEDTFDHTISNYTDPGNDPFDEHGWFLVRKEITRTDITIPRNECGGEANERITWGGPVIILRWDALTDIDIKFASVREIVPPKMSLRNLLKSNHIAIPVNLRNVGQFLRLPFPISVRDLAHRLL